MRPILRTDYLADYLRSRNLLCRKSNSTSKITCTKNWVYWSTGLLFCLTELLKWSWVMMALSEDGGVSQRFSASAPVFDLKELFFSPCLPSTHPMTFARSVFPFRFLIRHIYFCSQWSLCFGSVTQHNWNGKKKRKKKSFPQCLSKKHLNTSNKG